MRLLRETALREESDPPTVKMLDLWSSLSDKMIGASVEVLTGSRREHPRLRSFPGQMYTALPQLIQGRLVLVLWLDSLADVNFVIVTHEIGHWVIKLQGFRGMIYVPKKHCDMEILLNSLVHHPPLYCLQRSLGHQPQEEIDSRADHDIGLFMKDGETHDRSIWVNNALLVCDDLLNCSTVKRTELREVLTEKHPNTSKLVEAVVDSASNHNLLNSEGNLEFSKDVVKKLDLGTWRELDEIRELASMVKQ